VFTIVKLFEGESIIIQSHPQATVLVGWIFTKSILYTFLAMFLTIWSFGFFGGTFGFYFGLSVEDFHPISSGVPVAIKVAAIVFPLSFPYLYFLQRTFQYIVTNKRCIYRGGFIKRMEYSIPLHKVTDVEKSENIIENMLGVATVKVFACTPSENFSFFSRQPSEIVYEGLSDAEKVADVINKQILLIRKS